MQIKLITIEAHHGEGQYPTFAQGSEVKVIAACEKFANWYAAEIDGYSLYITRDFIENGRLRCDYNPTELVVEKNEVVELLELHYEWALVQRNDEIGWLPCEILKSL